MNSIETKVKAIIRERLSYDEKITNDTLLKDLGCDSLDVVELIMELEEAFDIHIPDEKVTQLNEHSTVKDIINFVHKKPYKRIIKGILLNEI